jgi:hypothetical protein
MEGIASRPIARLLFAATAVGAVVAAFLRGNYLLGVGCGVVYAAIAIALVWLLARSRTTAGRVSVPRATLVALFALPVGYAMAFPASINPDVQVFIDKQATDRRARAELAIVFASDPAYSGLSVSSVHLKVVNLTIQGSLSTRADLDRLRSRIGGECPALGECFLHWDVTLRDTGRRVDGLDRDVFQDADPGAAADGGRTLRCSDPCGAILARQGAGTRTRR